MMYKRLLISLVLVVLLITACNIPTGVPTPTVDIVATQVARILTEMPEPELPTPTAPQDTPFPTQVIETPTPTLEATPSPTSPPEDPRDILGAPTFVDTLESGRAFGLDGTVYDDDFTFIRVESGALVLTSRYATGYHGWRTGGTKLENAYIESTVRVGECAGTDTYGLVFRSPDFIKGYWFQVNCEGDWAFGYWDGSQYIHLESGSNVDTAFNTGSNQVNRLGVMAIGSNFTLFANGKKIAELEDSTFTDPGSYGMMISARATPNFTIYAEEFAYWKLN